MNKVLYLSIKDILKERILKKTLKPGDMLDSENSLMKEFSVSRMTIRKSLSLLSTEGYIYSVPGKGNFVCEPEIDLFELRFNKHDNFTVPIDKVNLLSVNVVKADSVISEKLGIREHETALTAMRVLCSEDVKVAFEKIYFKYIPNKPVIEDHLRFANHLKSIEQSLAFALKKSVKITGEKIDSKIASFLGCNDNDILFCVEEELINCELDLVFSYTKMYVKPEFFELIAHTSKEERVKKI